MKCSSVILTDRSCLAMSQGMHRSSTVQSDQRALLCPHTVYKAHHHTAV